MADSIVEIMLNYGEKDENDGDKVVNAMIGGGGQLRNPIKFDIDLKN